MFKTDPEKAAMILRTALNLMAVYATVSRPFIPDAADAIAAALDFDAPWPTDAAAALSMLPADHTFTVPDNLFRKIEDSEREAWESRFGGEA